MKRPETPLYLALAAVLAMTPFASTGFQATNIHTSGTLPTNCSVGNIYLKTGASAGFYTCLATDTWTLVGGLAGPVSSTDEALVRFDGTGGDTVQSSSVTLSDTGALSFPDGVRQTFNPSATVPGVNVGPQAGDPSTPTNGDLWYDSSANTLRARINGLSVSLTGTTTGLDKGGIGITINDGGGVLTSGVKGFILVPFSGTITSATLLSTDASVTSGSVVVDIWCDSYANYPPTDADSITSSTPPTLSSATKSQDTTLASWTTTVTEGHICGFNVDAPATSITQATLILSVNKT